MNHETQKIYIETYGCQMNFAQSTQLNQILVDHDFVQAGNYSEADIIIINACSVREHAEKKVFQRIQFYQSLKRRKKDMTLMVIGCFAQNNQDKIEADYIIGTSRFHQIPEILSKEFTRGPIHVDMDDYQFLVPVVDKQYPFKAMIDIMKGCDNYCSYCIVPYVRGKPISRRSMDIVEDIKKLAVQGVKEIYLLGQNVNSYGQDNHEIGFADLLYKLNALEGIERIRFITSHPKDFSYEIIDSIFQNKKVCPSIHLPIQSGSDRILRLMNRKYTVAQYFDIIDKLNSYQQDYSLSTDFLVGFPGETEEDFLQTIDVLKKVRFNEAFMFKYSSRPYIKANDFHEQLSEEIKLKRLDFLIQTQKQIEKEKIKDNINKERLILVENRSKKDNTKFYGRDNLNYVVIIDKPVNIGNFYHVKITSIHGTTLIGELI